VTAGAICMTMRLAEVNGIKLAYQVQGAGPPLVLIMGYRLNSLAWPISLVEQLARRFTVITPDNRGTGRSDKPVQGYAIANMARDVSELLDELGFAQVHMLGYSMGGAIAQEFVRQFPDRIKRLILCATTAGGPSATYAHASVVRVMRDLDGLTADQAARRIWTVTYAPDYLARHQELAEAQMQREIAQPTPLHAADLQFQAFAEFDASASLPDIRKPTLVLTGDLDRLISPQNSLKIAGLIPDAKLIVVPGGGHRVLWEATEECVAHITGFLGAVDEGRKAAVMTPMHKNASTLAGTLSLTAEWLTLWPATMANAALDCLAIARQSVITGSSSRFGDGKPIVLVPQHFGSDLALLPLLLWLNALGYRPANAGLNLNFGGVLSDRRLIRSIDEITTRVGRKAVLLAHSSSLPLALRVAEDRKERVSDVVVFDATYHAKPKNGVRTHFIYACWPTLAIMTQLPQLLRNIGIELIDPSVSSS
jgi:pimeloyl-ACP methyl ester carboxylesterase